MQELDERKQKILHAIIQNYLETGEPVGSRTISKYADLGLSSATIRNEMSDLEEMGYIIQPHTSAGSHRDEGAHDPAAGQDGTGIKADGQGLGSQYQLRHHDYLASVSPDEAEIHPAVGDQRRSAVGGCGSGRQCGEE